MDALGRRDAAFVPLDDHPRALVFSPSGHRIYVARRTEPGLAVIDRYEHAEIDGVALPTPAATIRLDPLGRWLLARRSEEHTSELQSLAYLVCRLLLEKK